MARTFQITGPYGTFLGSAPTGSYRPRPLAMLPPRTSVTHPLRIDWVPLGSATGALGITIAPGKHHYGMESDHKRDLAVDLHAIVEAGARVLVSLIEAKEREALRIPNLLREAETLGLEVFAHPIADVSTPSDRPGFALLVREVASRIRLGEKVVAHCKGGQGRAGMFAACVLVELGFAPKRAIEHVRAHRRGAIETRSQEQFVYGYAIHTPADRAEVARGLSGDSRLGTKSRALVRVLSSVENATRREIAAALRDPVGDKRLNDLAARGLADKVGRRVCRVTGKTATVWALVGSDPKPLPKRVKAPKPLVLTPEEREVLLLDLVETPPSEGLSKLLAWLRAQV